MDRVTAVYIHKNPCTDKPKVEKWMDSWLASSYTEEELQHLEEEYAPDGYVLDHVVGLDDNETEDE